MPATPRRHRSWGTPLAPRSRPGWRRGHRSDASDLSSSTAAPAKDARSGPLGRHAVAPAPGDGGDASAWRLRQRDLAVPAASRCHVSACLDSVKGGSAYATAGCHGAAPDGLALPGGAFGLWAGEELAPGTVLETDRLPV